MDATNPPLEIGAILSVHETTEHRTLFPISRRSTNYVGRFGVSRHDASGRKELFLFRSATDLFVEAVRTNHVVTRFNFEWKNSATRRTVARYKGEFFFRKRQMYDFAVAAEHAWTQYLFEKAAIDLEQRGYTELKLGKVGSVPFFGPSLVVRFRAGELEFLRGDLVERWNAKDVKTFEVQQGKILLWHKDAAAFGLRGKYSFTYSRIPNALLFITLVRRAIEG